jgi:hypothetical protein
MLCIPHETKESQSFLLLSIYPGLPIVFEIIRRIVQRWWADRLAVTSPDKVDQKPVEQVAHVMLFLASPAFAEALD